MFAQLLPYIVTALVSIFGSAGFWKFLQWRDARRDSKEEGTNAHLRAELAQMREEHRTCQSELAELRERVAVIEHHHSSYLARWLKGADKRVIWINDKAFLSIFAPLGLTRDNVIGKSFADILLDATASAEIDRLDAAALAHPETAASNVIKLHPLLPAMVVVKIAAVGRDQELVFEGYAYRTNDSMISAGFGAHRQMLALEASADHMMGAGKD